MIFKIFFKFKIKIQNKKKKNQGNNYKKNNLKKKKKKKKSSINQTTIICTKSYFIKFLWFGLIFFSYKKRKHVHSDKLFIAI